MMRSQATLLFSPLTIVCALVLLLPDMALAQAQDISSLPAPPWPVASVFGPRITYPTKYPNIVEFHSGIDYLGAYGNVIRAIESGRIVQIDYSGGFYIGIQGDPEKGGVTDLLVIYLHIFDDDCGKSLRGLTMCIRSVSDNGWPLHSANGGEVPLTREQAYSAIELRFFTDPITGTRTPVLLFYSAEGSVAKALSSIAGIPVCGDFTDNCKTQNLVKQGDVIATVGKSGGVGPHEHLQVEHTSVGPASPFNWVVRPYDPSYDPSTVPRFNVKAAIHIPSPGITLPAFEGAPTRLNVSDSRVWLSARIESRPYLDLNKVELFILSAANPDETKPIIEKAFEYNGQSTEIGKWSANLAGAVLDPSSAVVAGKSGVNPTIPASKAAPTTEVEFSYGWDFSALPAGNYIWRIKRWGINPSDPAETTDFPIRIGGGRATLAVTASGTGTGTITSSPAGINCGTGGSTCSATFPVGTLITLSAQANADSQFGGWGGDCTGTVASTSVTVSSDKVCTFSFNLKEGPHIATPITYSCSLVSRGNGFPPNPRNPAFAYSFSVGVSAPVGHIAAPFSLSFSPIFFTNDYYFSIDCGGWSILPPDAGLPPRICQRQVGQPESTTISVTGTELYAQSYQPGPAVYLGSPTAQAGSVAVRVLRLFYDCQGAVPL